MECLLEAKISTLIFEIRMASILVPMKSHRDAPLRGRLSDVSLSFNNPVNPVYPVKILDSREVDGPLSHCEVLLSTEATSFGQSFTSHQYCSTSPKFGPPEIAIFFLRLKLGFSYIKIRDFPIDLKTNNE